MKLPRPSTRGTMALVAVVALLLLLGGWLWLTRRVGHFLEVSSYHTLEGVRLSNPYLYPRSKAKSEWHLALG